MQTLQYIEATHQYLLDGKLVRSLSDVLDTAEVELCRRLSIERFGLTPDLRWVNEAVLQNKTAIGSQVDTANSLMLEGTWTEERQWDVSAESLPYVLALEKYWTQTGLPAPGTMSVQRPLYCRALDFATMPDWHSPISVCDLKCSANAQRTWGLRMAGQALAHGRARVERILHLRPKLKTRSWDVWERVDGVGDPRVFHPLDAALVRAAALERFGDPVFEQWRLREAA